MNYFVKIIDQLFLLLCSDSLYTWKTGAEKCQAGEIDDVASLFFRSILIYI